MAGGTPVTRHARSGDVNIAYQVLGSGAIDLVYVPGWISSVECQPASCPHSSNGWTTSAR